MSTGSDNHVSHQPISQSNDTKSMPIDNDSSIFGLMDPASSQRSSKIMDNDPNDTCDYINPEKGRFPEMVGTEANRESSETSITMEMGILNTSVHNEYHEHAHGPASSPSEDSEAKTLKDSDSSTCHSPSIVTSEIHSGAVSLHSKVGDLKPITQDKRINSVDISPIEPIVPHRDTLKRIRTNYRLRELTEEDYVGCLETIIERDYFPELIRLRMSNALMEAETRGDDQTADLIRKRLEKYDRNQEVNVRLKTVNNEKISLNLGKGGLTLDEFSRIFTSEDNRSFGRLMEQTILKVNSKSSWMEDGERKHNLALLDCQKKTNLGIKNKDLLSNKVVSRNSLFFNSPGPSREAEPRSTIRSANTYMPSDHDTKMDLLDQKQKIKRTAMIKETHYNKVNELITQFGFRECKELLDDEQRAMYDFVNTPLSVSGESQQYNVPKPVTREELAEKLRKKYHHGAAKTPLAKTPMAPTPLLVQNLIAKHRKGADIQLRKAYSSSKYSRGSEQRSVM